MIRRKPTKGFDPLFTMGLVSSAMWVFLPILLIRDMAATKKLKESP